MELIEKKFSRQFETAQALAPQGDPLLLYGAEKAFCIYRVPEDERNRVTEAVLQMNLKGTAEKISETVDRAQKCIESLL